MTPLMKFVIFLLYEQSISDKMQYNRIEGQHYPQEGQGVCSGSLRVLYQAIADYKRSFVLSIWSYVLEKSMSERST